MSHSLYSPGLPLIDEVQSAESPRQITSNVQFLYRIRSLDSSLFPFSRTPKMSSSPMSSGKKKQVK